MIFRTNYYQLCYENAAVRWIKSGSTEIVRMIYAAVRDHNWNTLEPVILSEKLNRNWDGFEVDAVVEYRQSNILFFAEYLIRGNGNKLVFEMKGEAKSSFHTCRLGFCVLHPIEECSGKKGTVIHPDNSKEIALFPEFISPHQPMKNMSGLEWWPSEKVSAKLKFEGDIFEMEDQRNWTDASYKTYCRPLDLPFPFEVKRGEKVYQKIVLEIEGDELSESLNDSPVVLRIDKEKVFKIPALGVCNTSRMEPLTDLEAVILKEFPFKHLRIELRLYERDWKLQLSRVTVESTLLDLPLFLVIYNSEQWINEWIDFKKTLLNTSVKVSYILMLGKNHQTNEEIFKRVQPELKKLFPNARIGAGVNTSFAELNRNRPETQLADFISFTISPQVHAFDSSTLVENLEAQEDMVRSARAYFPETPIYVSPVTLKQRFNVVATAEEPPPLPGELPPQVDTRQNTVFAAQWLVVSIKYVAMSGADLVTYFETVGWCGFIQGEFSPLLPDEFSAQAGDIFPVYRILKELVGFEEIVFSESNSPLTVQVVTVKNQKKTKIILVNFSGETALVEMEGIRDVLNGRSMFSNAEIPVKEKIELPPNEIVVLSTSSTQQHEAE